MIGKDDQDSSDDQEEGNPLSMDFDAQHHIQKQMSDQRLPDLKDNDSQQKFVNAKFMDLDWLFQDGNAKKMIEMLKNTPVEELYETEQIAIFIDLMWEKYQDAIFYKVYVPFVCLFIAVLAEFCFFIGVPSATVYWTITDISLQIIIIVNAVVFEIIEFLQMVQFGVWDYIWDFWNIID